MAVAVDLQQVPALPDGTNQTTKPGLVLVLLVAAMAEMEDLVMQGNGSVGNSPMAVAEAHLERCLSQDQGGSGA